MLLLLACFGRNLSLLTKRYQARCVTYSLLNLSPPSSLSSSFLCLHWWLKNAANTPCSILTDLLNAVSLALVKIFFTIDTTSFISYFYYAVWYFNADKPEKIYIITLTSIPFKSLFQDITHSVISHFTCLLNGTTQTHWEKLLCRL